MKKGIVLVAGAALLAYFLAKRSSSSAAGNPSSSSAPSGGSSVPAALPGLVPVDLADLNAYQVIDIPGWEPGIAFQDVTGAGLTRAADWLNANYTLPNGPSNMAFGTAPNLGLGAVLTFPGLPYRVFLQ
jgi:hypothetical protein